MPGQHATAHRAARRAGPHRPAVDGPQRHPSRWRACSRRSSCTRSAGRCSTVASTARPCRPCASKVASPATWCPTRSSSSSTTASHPIAPRSKPRNTYARSWRRPSTTVTSSKSSMWPPRPPPGLDHPVLRSLIDRNGLDVRAKLGWTDVAFFAGRGVPAANFGPGDSEVAHTAGEWVDRAQIESVHAAPARFGYQPARDFDALRRS